MQRTSQEFRTFFFEEKPLLLIEVGKEAAKGCAVKYSGKVKKALEAIFGTAPKGHKWMAIVSWRGAITERITKKK
jgi:hypothetical protein